MSDRFRDVSSFCKDFQQLNREQQLEVQVRKWNYEARYWQSRFDAAKERQSELEKENAELKAKLKLREKQLFERKSEKAKANSNGQANPENRQPSGNPRGQQKGKARENSSRRDYSDLPLREENYAVDESQQFCPKCGQVNPLIASEDESEIIEIEVKGYRRKIIKQKRRKGCGCDNGLPAIITAKGPGRILPRSPYGVSIWVELLLSKFRYAIPVNRSIHRFEDIGMSLPAGTLTDGLAGLLPLFESLYTKIKEHNRSAGQWGGDETGYKVFTPVEGKVGNLWQLWVFHSHQAVVYLLRSSRSAKVPLDYFDEQTKGILVVDRYSAYKKLARFYSGLTLAFCWAHLRRDFLDCATQWPELQDWAFEWVERINSIFHLNNKRREAFFQSQDYQQEDQGLRQQIKVFKEQVDQERSESYVPAGKRSVLESLNNHWPGLTVFVDHPEVPMDNNGSERALRLSKLIVKNSYGCMSHWSVQLTEALLSIFATLQLWKINPRIWLTSYLEACADAHGEVPENSNEFLPWQMHPPRVKQFQKSTSHAFDSS
jgi:transposase